MYLLQNNGWEILGDYFPMRSPIIVEDNDPTQIGLCIWVGGYAVYAL